jgi:hypothetical protein
MKKIAHIPQILVVTLATACAHAPGVVPVVSTAAVEVPALMTLTMSGSWTMFI